MLNINNNIIFTILIYIYLLFVELFHFGSDVYIIIMLESFLCFSIILYLLSFIFQEVFFSDLGIITFKYNYIYIFFKNMVNLKSNVYNMFINMFLLLLIFFFKNERLIKNLKNKLKIEYIKTLIYLETKLNNFLNFYLRKFSYKVNLFI